MNQDNTSRLKKVIRTGLCNRCGTCVGLSDGKIQFKNKLKNYIPVIETDLDQETAEKIYRTCSGKGFDFPKYRKLIFNSDNNFHTYTGSYKNIYIGYSNDHEIRANSASGGIITQILLWLLEHKKIEGAVVLRMSEEEPWQCEPFIATTPEGIIDAAQSKYIISSVNEILTDIRDFKGRLAFVGLPGQIQSIRMLQEINDPSVKNIKYIFGPFYGNTLYFSAIKSFLRTNGVKDYKQIKKLYFRYGEWPGHIRIELNNGRVIQLRKFLANYLIPFNILNNSLLCTDYMNEYADISVGDAWAPVYEERGKGFSLVFSRTESGQNILDEMAESGIISIAPETEEKAIEMHSHGIDLKKRGAFIRFKYRRLLGLANPEYGYKVTGISAGRHLFEVILDILFLVMNTRLSRYIVESLPNKFVGSIFEKYRTWWKKGTYNVKRKSL